jgi:hypothetical protein
VKHKNYNTVLALARAGAPHRIKQLEQELQAIYSEFPDLFPHGKPFISGPERTVVKDRAGKAKAMIEQAETMLDETPEDLVLIREAAAAIGLSTAGVRNWIDRGKLKVKDHEGVRGAARVSLTQAKAIARNGIVHGTDTPGPVEGTHL